ncbi:MAG: ABC transporter substrate-binding protein [Candidatus Micrarchaeia archaeon]
MGKPFLFAALLLAAVLSLSLLGCASQNQPPAANNSQIAGNNSQIANPASQNCISKGGTLSIVSEAGGERGICTLPGGAVCDEWAYYRGECPVKTGPASDGITISIVPQDEAGAALESGKLDYYLSPLSAVDVQGIKSNPSTAVALYPAVSTFMGIYFNPAPASAGINAFSSQKARFALNFLIDREKIAREVYGGAAFPMVSIPWPGHPSYASISSAVDSFNITYDKAKGMKLLGEAMAGQGATMVNGTWRYNGAPITLVMPLYNGTGASSTRFMLADMVASDLRAAGFAVQTPKFDDYNAMPQYTTDPLEMKWNVDVSGAVFYGASKYQPAYFLAPDRQGGWWQYNSTAMAAAEEMMGNAATQAEWNSANDALARLCINDSIGLWLVALDSDYGAGKDVQGIVDNRFIGIGDYGTARQASVNGKKTLSIGTPDLYDAKASWNPVVVESIYMMGLLNTIHDPAWTADPATLEEKPYRWGFAIEKYPEPQPLPQGAFMWSVEGKKWVATPANATAKTKVTYDLSRYIGANWHNGREIGWADVLYFLASTSDRTYDSEKQKIASSQYKGTLDAAVGYRISGSKLETYLGTQDLDEGSMLAVARMFQRAAPFEIYAADDVVVFAQKKYAYGDVAGSGLPPLSLVNGSHISDVLAAMGSLTDAQIAPMVTADGVNYLGSGELSARLKADKAWNAEHGHLVISDGAFYLDYYSQADGSAHLKAFRDPPYPFAAGAWLEK